MSPRNKKRFLRKKHNRSRRDVKNVGDKQRKQEQPGRSAHEIESEKSIRKKRKFLDIIEKITNLLKSDGNNNLLKLLEQITNIMEQRSKEENNLRFQLIRMFFMHLLECDEAEIYALKVNMSSKLLPNELRKLTVDVDDLIVNPAALPLATGEYSVLKEGYLRKSNGARVHVVIKQALHHEDDQLILSEAKVMAQLDHENLRKILAIHKGVTGFRFAMKFMRLGVLEKALQKYKFTNKKLLLMVKEVAAGMQYIAQKKYVHRDLRCTKIFLDSHATCKIGGFKHCRYVGDTEGVCDNTDMDPDELYLSPETLRTDKFTTETDMWAMGLLVWEIFFMSRNLLRDDPLLPMEILKIYFLNLFMYKDPLPKPGRCSPFVWMYIQDKVLNEDPKARPTFAELGKALDGFDSLSSNS